MNWPLYNDSARAFATHGRSTRRLAMLASDAGTVSIEFMLWMPLIFTIILFACDVSLIYLKQANMWTAARDQARIMSTTPTYTNNNAQSGATAELFNSLQSASSLSVVATGGASNGTDKVVTIQVPLCQASLFGIVGCPGTGLTLTARVTMASEF